MKIQTRNKFAGHDVGNPATVAAGPIDWRLAVGAAPWPEAVFGAFESDLDTVIARLRAVLGDSGEHPRFIETTPKRGYCPAAFSH